MFKYVICQEFTGLLFIRNLPPGLTHGSIDKMAPLHRLEFKIYFACEGRTDNETRQDWFRERFGDEQVTRLQWIGNSLHQWYYPGTLYPLLNLSKSLRDRVAIYGIECRPAVKWVRVNWLNGFFTSLVALGDTPPMKTPLISLWLWVAQGTCKILSVISTNITW